ncbi:MAG: hypothetical protein HY717_22815 [Planctomycetes bacterium]|nr:hypothetical protein [Planctomycetota bacterium]
MSAGPLAAEELARSCQTRTGGRFTGILMDLELEGFIERYVPLSKGLKSRLVRYRIDDEYLHFYFRFIQKHQQEIITGRFSSIPIFQGRDYLQWQGYAFERLCRKHSWQIADHLRFSGIQYKAGSWFDPKSKTPGSVQIDLLFERADRVLTICEAKYADRLSAEKTIQDFERRCRALLQRYPRFGLQKVLLLGKEIKVPAPLRRNFDEILYAGEVFF